jgi:inorganic pyrophosphatase
VLVNDAWFHGLHDIVDVNKHQLVEIQEFFETYKRLEPHKWAKVKGWKNAAEPKTSRPTSWKAIEPRTLKKQDSPSTAKSCLVKTK